MGGRPLTLRRTTGARLSHRSTASHAATRSWFRRRNVSCAEALTVVRAKESGIGVTFVGNPEGPASQFRWKLYGLPGWTCFGDGSGFPGHGAGGVCTKAGATVEWYHA
jgi:hypothetical protein